MDMLRVFFEKTNEDTSVYFKDKQIWQCGDYYTKHQGQYPVIFLTFKDVKSMTWEETFQKIRRLISLEFIRHNELETSSVLTAYEKNNIIFLPETAGMKSIVRWVCSFYHYCFISIMEGNVSLSLMNMTHPSSRGIPAISIRKL